MAIKAKTRKAPAETGINPKLTAIAAQIDEAKAHWRSLSDRVEGADDQRAADHIAGIAFDKILKLEDRLAAIVAVSMEEMKLKARYADIVDVDDAVTESIIRDVLALSRKPESSENRLIPRNICV